MLAGTGLAEERVERVVFHSNGLVGGHRAVRLNSVFQTEQLPACIAHLATGLTNVYANHLTHLEIRSLLVESDAVK